MKRGENVLKFNSDVTVVSKLCIIYNYIESNIIQLKLYIQIVMYNLYLIVIPEVNHLQGPPAALFSNLLVYIYTYT